MPTLRVAPFVVHGTPDTRAIAAETLGSKLAEAFALFDLVNIMVAAPNMRATTPAAGAPSGPGARSDYRLDGVVEYRGDLTVDLRFKLVDESEATVVWSRSFDKLSGAEGSGDIEHKLILELASALVQPYGVIMAHDRAKRLSPDSLDPRYRGLLQAGEAFRTFDPAALVHVRDRLEQLSEIDPNFALGFPYLAAIYAREHMTGLGMRPDDPPALDRALKAARRGIELRPQSARAYHILFIVLFLRGEIDAAMAAAEKAIALNRYDILIMADYGGRLIMAGEVDGGMDILRGAVEFGAILPSWNHFYLFVGHYMRGDLVEARYQASQLTNETHVYGQLARALVAFSERQREETRRALRAILSLQPAWRDDPRGEIGKLITAPAIVDRLAGDLSAAGFPDKFENSTD
jgi:tetratricopeptide (TPR) repeat protein